MLQNLLGSGIVATLVYVSSEEIKSLRKLDCFFNYFHINFAFKYLDFNASFFESSANEFTEFFFIAAVSNEFCTGT